MMMRQVQVQGGKPVSDRIRCSDGTQGQTQPSNCPALHFNGAEGVGGGTGSGWSGPSRPLSSFMALAAASSLSRSPSHPAEVWLQNGRDVESFNFHGKPQGNFQG